MKKIVLFSASVMTVAMMSGCGFIPQLPELTQNQEEVITEYAAGLLLKYDKAYDNGLLSEEELVKAEAKELEQIEKAKRQKELADEYVAKSEKAREEKEKEKAEKNKDKKNSKDEAEQKQETVGPAIISGDSLGDFLELGNIGVSYNGFDSMKSYPENGSGAFSIDASNGNKLIVTKFALKNNSGDKCDVDMFHQTNAFVLVCADGSSYQSSTTLLLDDFSIYKNSLEANASENTVLLFEIPEEKDLTGALLQIVTDNGVGDLNL